MRNAFWHPINEHKLRSFSDKITPLINSIAAKATPSNCIRDELLLEGVQSALAACFEFEGFPVC